MFSPSQLSDLRVCVGRAICTYETTIPNTALQELKTFKLKRLSRLISLYTIVDDQLDLSAQKAEVDKSGWVLTSQELASFERRLRDGQKVNVNNIYLRQIYISFDYKGTFTFYPLNPEIVELKWSDNYTTDGSKSGLNQEEIQEIKQKLDRGCSVTVERSHIDQLYKLWGYASLKSTAIADPKLVNIKWSKS